MGSKTQTRSGEVPLLRHGWKQANAERAAGTCASSPNRGPVTSVHNGPAHGGCFPDVAKPGVFTLRGPKLIPRPHKQSPTFTLGCLALGVTGLRLIPRPPEGLWGGPSVQEAVRSSQEEGILGCGADLAIQAEGW